MRNNQWFKMLPVFCVAFLFNATLKAQWQHYQNRLDDPNLPEFVKMICQPPVDVLAVEESYQAYYKESIAPLKEAHKSNPATASLKFKNEFEHLYKAWRSVTLNYRTPDGLVDFSEEADKVREDIRQQIHGNSVAERGGGIWEPKGPMEIIDAQGNGKPISWQTNIYCIGTSNTFPNHIMAGTESGGVFRTVDKGQNWTQLATDQNFRTIYAAEYWPANPGYMLVAIPGKIMFSDDNGLAWGQTNINANGGSMSNNFRTFKILYTSIDQGSKTFAATSEGLLISDDYGHNWTRHNFNVGNNTRVTDIIEHPTNPLTLYALLYDPATKLTRMVRTDNHGDSWFYLDNGGWFSIPPEDQGKIDVWGGRLAVTPADPDRIYVLLNGFSQADANLQLDGFIGVYQSNDGGFFWTRKTGPIGRPYNLQTRPNLMSFPWQPHEYNQVTYLNNAIAASTVDPDHLLIGSLSFWESTDAGASWGQLGGYGGNVPYIHPDSREIVFRSTGAGTEELLWCSDGGFNYTADGNVANHEARNYGLHAHEFWGFEADSRTHLMGGGSYHNGNNMYYGPNYPEGTWKHVGGAENFTGYAQYGANPRMWFVEFTPFGVNAVEDVNDDWVPYQYPSILDHPDWQPNRQKGYDYTRASRILFDRTNPKIIYWGRDDKFIRSLDDGQTAEVLHNFGTDLRVEWLEQSQDDPKVMYAKIENEANNQYRLYRTTDGGRSWSMKFEQPANFYFAPLGNTYLYRANDVGGTGSKVWNSTDGGDSWNDMTTSTLDNLIIRTILSVDNLENDFYVATDGGGIFNYNYFTNQWDNVSQGMNPGVRPARLVANYERQTLQLGTVGLGMWERDFVNAPVAVTMYLASDFDKNICAGEPVHFFNRTCASGNSTYLWTFPGGTPSSSTDENPVITYDAPGVYPITLSITDMQNNINASFTKTDFITVVGTYSLPHSEEFEAGSLNPEYILTDGNEDGENWRISTQAGGFGNSQNSMYFPNYSVNVQGAVDEVRTVKVDLSGATTANLSFDLAYTYYESGGDLFADSLEVAISTDCGKTFTTALYSGGEALATAPSSSTSFLPSAGEWASKNIDLSAFLGQSDVLIAFRNIGYYGNNLFIDNINIEGNVVSAQEEEIQQSLTVAPNPNPGLFQVQFDLPEAIDGELVLVNAVGQTVYRNEVKQPAGTYQQTIQAQGVAPGTYFLMLRGEKVYWRTKVVVN